MTSPAVVAQIAPHGPVTDPSGATWSSDAAYTTAGVAWRSTADILGTEADVLYQGERYGSFDYRIPAPVAGTYRVVINEAELVFSTVGRRVFNIMANGVLLASNVDIFKAAGGRFKPVVMTFDVAVTTGTLVLSFVSVVNNARVSSVLVTAPALYGNPLTGNPTAPIYGFFGPNSIWKTDLTGAPVAADSDALVANLARQVAAYYGGIAAFNVWQYNSSTYTVGASQARINLIWDDCQHKGYVPFNVCGPNGFLTQVPLPSDAVPSAGSDASIGIYQPSSDTYWGFWKLNKQADGWHACWGGKIPHVSQSPGWYDNYEGVSATGLADGGSIGIKEAQAGGISHAIALAIPFPSNLFSWPAQRSDGKVTGLIPEGTRFRLDPALDLNALGLSPLAIMVAKAAQRYGFIVTDTAGCVSVGTESGAAVAAITGINPWNALMGTTPSYAVLKHFPWSNLQALPMDWGKPAT